MNGITKVAVYNTNCDIAFVGWKGSRSANKLNIIKVKIKIT